MRKYYLVVRESNPKIIGAKNGIAQLEIKKDGFKNPNDYDDIIEFFDAFEYWKKKSFAPTEHFIIEHAQLLEESVLTDFMSFNPHLMACPFIINEKIKSIFEECVMPEYYLFNVNIFDKLKLVSGSYYLLYCPYLKFEKIDFSKSTFYTGNKILGKKEIYLSSKEEYVAYLEGNPLLQCDDIVLIDEFDDKLDFFIPRIGGMYVSDRLKRIITNKNLTGIKVLP